MSRFAGVVPEQASEMEEAQEEHQRVPFPGRFTTVARSATVRRW